MNSRSPKTDEAQEDESEDKSEKPEFPSRKAQSSTELDSPDEKT